MSAAVVCLHGLGRTPADWDGVLDSLGTAVAPRLPGDWRAALDVADRAIDPGAIVVGHSMGGVLVQRLMRERPRPLRAVVLTGCFFPPARNGRGLGASVADYARHRMAFVRGRRAAVGGERSPRALLSLAVSAVRPRGPAEALSAVAGAVLVVHARDDHHVPVDFAMAAAASSGWDLRVLEQGGHHAHVTEPARWLDAVSPWLAGV